MANSPTGHGRAGRPVTRKLPGTASLDSGPLPPDYNRKIDRHLGLPEGRLDEIVAESDRRINAQIEKSRWERKWQELTGKVWGKPEGNGPGETPSDGHGPKQAEAPKTITVEGPSGQGRS
ncbi:MAG: hypothetical protein HY426_01010 [Candidatus Levybacteria bacterium]|nr:hypothetical protein [Candidatus Levybacteria bacterium]